MHNSLSSLRVNNNFLRTERYDKAETEKIEKKMLTSASVFPRTQVKWFLMKSRAFLIVKHRVKLHFSLVFTSISQNRQEQQLINVN